MNMKLIKNTENISKEKITLFCLPFLGTLDVGGKVVLASATSPDDILDAITEEVSII